MSNVSGAGGPSKGNFMRELFKYAKEAIEEKQAKTLDLITKKKAEGATVGDSNATDSAKEGAKSMDSTLALEVQLNVNELSILSQAYTNTMKADKDATSGILRNTA